MHILCKNMRKRKVENLLFLTKDVNEKVCDELVSVSQKKIVPLHRQTIRRHSVSLSCLITFS